MFYDDVLFRFTAARALDIVALYAQYFWGHYKMYRVDTTNKTIGRRWSLISYTFLGCSIGFCFFFFIRNDDAAQILSKATLESNQEWCCSLHEFQKQKKKKNCSNLGLMLQHFTTRYGADWFLIFVKQPQQLLTSPWRGSKMTDDDENLIVVCSRALDGMEWAAECIVSTVTQAGKSSIMSWWFNLFPTIRTRVSTALQYVSMRIQVRRSLTVWFDARICIMKFLPFWTGCDWIYCIFILCVYLRLCPIVLSLV